MKLGNSEFKRQQVPKNTNKCGTRRKQINEETLTVYRLTVVHLGITNKRKEASRNKKGKCEVKGYVQS